MPADHEYDRGQRIAGVVFVAGLGAAMLAAGLAFTASERWELAGLVGGIIALVAFLGAAVVAAAMSESPRR